MNMCCEQINTEVLLANLFAAAGPGQCFSLTDIGEYLGFLLEQVPTHVSSDLSAERVLDCSNKYPLLYNITGHGGEMIVGSGSLRPKLQYFNAIYTNHVADYLVRITKTFLKQRAGC